MSKTQVMGRKRKKQYDLVEFDPELHGPNAFKNWNSASDVIETKKFRREGEPAEFERLTVRQYLGKRTDIEADEWLRLAKEGSARMQEAREANERE